MRIVTFAASNIARLTGRQAVGIVYFGSIRVVNRNRVAGETNQFRVFSDQQTGIAGVAMKIVTEGTVVIGQKCLGLVKSTNGAEEDDSKKDDYRHLDTSHGWPPH